MCGRYPSTARLQPVRRHYDGGPRCFSEVPARMQWQWLCSSAADGRSMDSRLKRAFSYRCIFRVGWGVRGGGGFASQRLIECAWMRVHTGVLHLGTGPGIQVAKPATMTNHQHASTMN